MSGVPPDYVMPDYRMTVRMFGFRLRLVASQQQRTCLDGNAHHPSCDDPSDDPWDARNTQKGNSRILRIPDRSWCLQGWSPFGWVPGSPSRSASPSGPPTLKDVTREEAARRRAYVAEFGHSGFGDEEVDLSLSPEPQNEDDPDTLKSAPSVDCNISVSFKQHTFFQGDPNYPNGPNAYMYGDFGFGLGFTVTGSVKSGGIGNIGGFPTPVTNPENPKGVWTIQQWVSDYAKANDSVMINDQGARRDQLDIAPLTIKGNKFSWWDQPGQPNQGVKSYWRSSNFTVKVYNGSKQCEVKFHFIMTFTSTGGWDIHWGSGNL
jgi:hypothetical protein